MKILIFSLLSFLTTPIFAQRTFEKDGINIETRKERVIDKNANDFDYEYEVLTIKNNTNTSKTVVFHKAAFYNETCWTCENDEYKVSFTLKPNEIIKGKVTDRDKGLTVFIKDYSGRIKEELSDFQLLKFEVK